MAARGAPGILVVEMVVGAYIERHLFICCLRDRRCAIERLGVGWLFLSFLPIHHPIQATHPSLPQNTPPCGTLLAAVSRHISGGRGLTASLREGSDGW